MKKQKFRIALALLIAFVLWTTAIRLIDVQAIGPKGTTVGFATINRIVHSLTGVHMTLYTITDWLGLIPLAFVLGFALLGLAQWIKRKSILKVDYSMLILGGFYIATMAAYLFFEYIIINFRPVLIEGVLEASYPSSTTMLVMCVMPTSIMQFHNRINHTPLRTLICTILAVFTVFMVVSRLFSGVHWLTDIIGGLLLSASLVLMYRSLTE